MHALKTIFEGGKGTILVSRGEEGDTLISVLLVFSLNSYPWVNAKCSGGLAKSCREEESVCVFMILAMSLRLLVGSKIWRKTTAFGLSSASILQQLLILSGPL